MIRLVPETPDTIQKYNEFNQYVAKRLTSKYLRQYVKPATLACIQSEVRMLLMEFQEQENLLSAIPEVWVGPHDEDKALVQVETSRWDHPCEGCRFLGRDLDWDLYAHEDSHRSGIGTLYNTSVYLIRNGDGEADEKLGIALDLDLMRLTYDASEAMRKAGRRALRRY